MRGKKGFTLIEMLVVIAIILLLISLLMIMVKGVIDRARYAKTTTLVNTISAGCDGYKLDFGIFPRDDKGDSRCLHFYLGRVRKLEAQKTDTGTSPKITRPPYINFTMDMLQSNSTGPADPDQPLPIIDAWGNPLRYKVAPQAVWNKIGVDIWSLGSNGEEELDPAHPKFDDVTNWYKET